MRGQAISYNMGENKRKTNQITELIDRIEVVDQIHSTSPSQSLYRDRISLQTKFEALTNDNPIDLHLKSRYVFYEYGVITKFICESKLLSHQLKQAVTTDFILAIKDRNSNIVTDQKDIEKERRFKSFYEKIVHIRSQ